eukprot:5443173-Prymnesium_polylepis.1
MLAAIAVAGVGLSSRGARPPHALAARRSACAPLACAPAPEVPFELREARSFGDGWAAARLLHDCFGGASAYYYASLRAPGLESNIFFGRVEAPEVVVAARRDGAVVGVAQLLRARLTAATGAAPGDRAVAFIREALSAKSEH